MITIYPYEQLGAADHDWLKAKYHFSFADYHNPSRRQFGALRVINDDRIAPHTGFAPHPHNNMEIITYVRQGAISHQDSMGNTGRTAAGDVQVMSAGSGITHSEFNLESEETRLFQIWIRPSEKDVEPRWDSAVFGESETTDSLPILVSGRQDDIKAGAMMMHQDAAIAGGKLAADRLIRQPVKHQAYILVSEGEIAIDGHVMKAGDGAEVTGSNLLEIKAKSDSELLVIDVPS